MINVNINETFPITVTLMDETTDGDPSGKMVYYDVRKLPGDVPLDPVLSGTLAESAVEVGVYKTMVSISEYGNYIVYATCSGFLTSTENIVVEEEDLTALIKQNRHYNIAVEDVVRTEVTPTASQVTRKVPFGKTDYVITRIKPDGASDWTDPGTVQSTVYAWYESDTDEAPYKMGAET
jgi:hypothetical protein